MSFRNSSNQRRNGVRNAANFDANGFAANILRAAGTVAGLGMAVQVGRNWFESNRPRYDSYGYNSHIVPEQIDRQIEAGNRQRSGYTDNGSDGDESVEANVTSPRPIQALARHGSKHPLTSDELHALSDQYQKEIRVCTDRGDYEEMKWLAETQKIITTILQLRTDVKDANDFGDSASIASLAKKLDKNQKELKRRQEAHLDQKSSFGIDDQPRDENRDNPSFLSKEELHDLISTLEDKLRAVDNGSPSGMLEWRRLNKQKKACSEAINLFEKIEILDDEDNDEANKIQDDLILLQTEILGQADVDAEQSPGFIQSVKNLLGSEPSRKRRAPSPRKERPIIKLQRKTSKTTTVARPKAVVSSHSRITRSTSVMKNTEKKKVAPKCSSNESVSTFVTSRGRVTRAPPTFRAEPARSKGNEDCISGSKSPSVVNSNQQSGSSLRARNNDSSTSLQATCSKPKETPTPSVASRKENTQEKSAKRPGPTKVFEQAANEFGEGWVVKGYERSSGKYKGHVDKYFFSPKTKKRFRSKGEVKQFLKALEEANGDENTAYYLLTGKQFPSASKPRRINDTKEGVYHVSRILGRTYNSNTKRIEYLILWEGYESNPKDFTLESLENIDSYADTIADRWGAAVPESENEIEPFEESDVEKVREYLAWRSEQRNMTKMSITFFDLDGEAGNEEREEEGDDDYDNSDENDDDDDGEESDSKEDRCSRRRQVHVEEYEHSGNDGEEEDEEEGKYKDNQDRGDEVNNNEAEPHKQMEVEQSDLYDEEEDMSSTDERPAIVSSPTDKATNSSDDGSTTVSGASVVFDFTQTTATASPNSTTQPPSTINICSQ